MTEATQDDFYKAILLGETEHIHQLEARIVQLERVVRDYLRADLDAFSPTELRDVRRRARKALDEKP